MMTLMKAVWNGAVIADSDDGVEVEGNYYFPLDSVKKEFLAESKTHTVCPWKGIASYYDVVVDGKRNKDAAWRYPYPKPAALQVRNRVAFWQGVRVVPSDAPVPERDVNEAGSGVRVLVGKLLGR